MEKRRKRKRLAKMQTEFLVKARLYMCSCYLSQKGMILDHHVDGHRTILFSSQSDLKVKISNAQFGKVQWNGTSETGSEIPTILPK